MLKRTFSTFILWLVAILVPASFGPTGAVWILAFIALITQYELYSLLFKTGFRPQRRLGCLFGLFLILGSWYLPQYTNLLALDVSNDIFTLAVIVISLTVIIRPDFTEAKYNIMPTLLGLILVPFMLNFYTRIFQHFNELLLPNTGLLLVLWLIGVAKFTDVGGLLLGSIFGRHKLAQAISPGKTWEGAFGGIFIACLLGVTLCIAFKKLGTFPSAFSPLKAFFIAIPVATISIASDLIESVLKRKAGVKDSGRLFPGIGGAFDLTDSLLLSAPCGYLIFKYTIF